MQIFLEWACALFGLAGALLLAFKCRWSSYGFGICLLSNAALFSYSTLGSAFGLAAMQIFGACTLFGLWKWLLKPYLLAMPTPEVWNGVE